MSYIGNSPGVSSQRVVTEEVVSGSPKSAFYPVGGYALGYVDVLVNGVEVDSSDFTASDGVVVTLATAAAVGETVKIKAYLPRGLSDGYLKSEADARFPRVDVNNQGLNSTQQGNARTNINAQAALGYTPVNSGGDQMSGRLKIVYSGMANPPATTDLAASAGFAMSLGGGDYFAIGQYTNSKIWLQGAYGANPSLAKYNMVLQPLGGDVEIGNGNLVLASGKGIDFSAGSNASGMTGELLDDYEVGTWTPVTSVNGFTQSVSTLTGRYTKIGRLVTLSLKIQLSTPGRPTSYSVFTGAPFTTVEDTPLVLSSDDASMSQAYGSGYITGTSIVPSSVAGTANISTWIASVTYVAT